MDSETINLTEEQILILKLSDIDIEAGKLILKINWIKTTWSG